MCSVNNYFQGQKPHPRHKRCVDWSWTTRVIVFCQLNAHNALRAGGAVRHSAAATRGSAKLFVMSMAITGLTFRNLKQITIKESLAVGKNTLHRAVPCDSHGSCLVNIVSFGVAGPLRFMDHNQRLPTSLVCVAWLRGVGNAVSPTYLLRYAVMFQFLISGKILRNSLCIDGIVILPIYLSETQCQNGQTDRVCGTIATLG